VSGYSPELGQAAFGNPWKELAVPVDVEEAIDAIRCAIGLFYDGDNPFSNNGARIAYTCFSVSAYDWGAAMDDDAPGQPWNFKWRDFELSWYKYWGRGMSRNRKISKAELREMVAECLKAVLSESPDNVA
jgi:hypothetical protein